MRWCILAFHDNEKGRFVLKKTVNSVTVTLWANHLVALLLVALLFTLPMLLDWYCQYRVLTAVERTALTAAFYCCAVFVGIALWNMDRLLRAIAGAEVFIRENVRRISVVRWCCVATCLICLPAAFCYYPLVFLVVIMGFLSLVVSVVCRVMDAAVTIREENDLTV